MNPSLRKGWCPGALRPMTAKDGLLVRLRIAGGILAAATAAALADLATRYGNGRFDLSGRGNLQMRGIRESALPALHDGLRTLCLLDRDAAAESVRNVMGSPLAGLLGGLDIRPLVQALESRLTEDTALHALPGKFGVLIDDGTDPSLANIDADVRFDWSDDSGRFFIGLAGARGNAVRIGVCDPTELVDHAARIGSGALALMTRDPDARRMRDLVTTFGADRVARACGGARDDTLPPVRSTKAHDIVGRRSFRRPAPVSARARMDLTCLGLATPFGRLDAPMLQAAAHCAMRTATAELRLTPWRILLIPDAPEDASTIDGFITDPRDSRLAIAACVGVEGCERGTTSTHADAAHLAAHVLSTNHVGPTNHEIMMHVSGCAKGCAKPSPSPLTLVARDGRYDLVRNGKAGDPPVRRGLDLATVLDTILEPA